MLELHIKDFRQSATVSIILEPNGSPSCYCNLFSSKGIVHRHLINHFTFNGIAKLPLAIIMDRWKIRYRTSHGISTKAVHEVNMDKSNVKEFCVRIMEIRHKGVDDVSMAMSLCNDFHSGNVIWEPKEFVNCNASINSISWLKYPISAGTYSNSKPNCHMFQGLWQRRGTT